MPTITSRFGSFTLPDADYTIGQMDVYEVAVDELTDGKDIKGTRRKRMIVYTAAHRAGLLGEWKPGTLADPAPSPELPAAFVEWASEAVLEKFIRERDVPKG